MAQSAGSGHSLTFALWSLLSCVCRRQQQSLQKRAERAEKQATIAAQSRLAAEQTAKVAQVWPVAVPPYHPHRYPRRHRLMLLYPQLPDCPLVSHLQTKVVELEGDLKRLNQQLEREKKRADDAELNTSNAYKKQVSVWLR
jgi:hypothetical protein